MKKSALALLFSFLLFFLFFKPVFAQVSPYNAPNNNPDVPQNMHTYSQNVMIEVLSALNCQLSGVDIVNPNQECLGVDRQTGKIGFVKNGGGAIGAMGNLISITFTPPLHTGDYVNYLAQNFGLVKPAYAQNEGHGFTQFTPLIKLWSTFRNIVYLTFVLLFVIIGVAIMLRIKIDPRTVMTIENQIPKIIVGLILVTFSFAIAGVLIDLTWVFIYIIVNIFAQADPSINIPQITSDLGGSNVFGFANNNLGGEGWGILGVVGNSAGAVSSIMSSLLGGSLGGGFIEVVLKMLGMFAGGIGAVVASLVIFIAIIWALFRLWFTLISSYVFILLDVAMAPLWIIVGILPGGGLGFSGWLRDILANLVAFPATIAMFLVGNLLMNAYKNNPDPTKGGFVPPLVGNPGDNNSMMALVGLGIILLTPAIVDMLKKAFKAPKLDLSMIFRGLAAGGGAPISAGKSVAAYYNKPYPDSMKKAGIWGAARNIFKF